MRRAAALFLPVLLAGCGSATRSARGAKASLVGPTGGSADALDFAVVGDTRPALPDGIASYPTAIVTRIWQDIENESPRPDFAVATGDYMLADPYSDEGSEQLDTYLQARSGFSNVVFYAMGNHECATVTSINCGPGTFFGDTNTVKAFEQKMLAPIGQTKPYYSFHVDASDGSWTSKFVVIAGNYWNDDQAAWLESAMSEPTTYTFVVRHEGYAATSGPGVTPSEAILANHPYTLMLAGHVHTWSYDAAHKEVITGNGGAPLTGSIGYGYTVVQQQSDGTIHVANYDYQTHDVNGELTVDADGTPVP